MKINDVVPASGDWEKTSGVFFTTAGEFSGEVVKAIASFYPENPQRSIDSAQDSATSPNAAPVAVDQNYDPDDLERVFNRLVQNVLSATRSESSTQRISMHPAYQQIIRLGQSVVPLLLREVERKSGRWFWVLKAITREEPVPESDRGKTRKMIDAWLNWGNQKGYWW